jgi:hemerythrin-like domain-containing protein
MLSMLITDALLGEHAVFHLFLVHFEKALPALVSLSALQHRFAAFAFALEAHADLEDELLFTALEPHLGDQAGPLAVMRFEHNQIINLFGKIESAADLDSARDFARQLFPIVRRHFQKEEQALFEMAGRFLSEDELSTLGGQWAMRRKPLVGLELR